MEEESSDNFCNYNNAKGCIAVVKRADDAIEVAMKFIERSPNMLLITAVDSDAGDLKVIGYTNLPSPLLQKKQKWFIIGWEEQKINFCIYICT